MGSSSAVQSEGAESPAALYRRPLRMSRSFAELFEEDTSACNEALAPNGSDSLSRPFAYQFQRAPGQEGRPIDSQAGHYDPDTQLWVHAPSPIPAGVLPEITADCTWTRYTWATWTNGYYVTDSGRYMDD